MSKLGMYVWAQATARQQPGFENAVCLSADSFGDGRVLAALANTDEPGLCRVEDEVASQPRVRGGDV
jgi:hypothetical protein